MNEIEERSTAANAEPVRAAVAPKPGADRLTASTITDERLDALYAERDRAQATLAEVRELHVPLHRAYQVLCRDCSSYDGFRCLGVVTPWPCPTVAALDGPSPAPATPTAAAPPHAGLLGAPGAPGGPR